MGCGEPELREAAFGGRPEALVYATDDAPRARWLSAVVLGGQGRYAAAATVLTGLLSHYDPVVAALAGTTLASHRRQLGCHSAARVLDSAALGRLATAGFANLDGMTAPGHAPDGRYASNGAAKGVGPGSADPDGVDAAGALDDALLGLAADAIGSGRLGEARRLYARAVRGDAGTWRARVRGGWVGAELELAAGQPARAVPLAEAAAATARSAAAVRHVVKSDLVLGAALATAGSADAVAVLRHGFGLAVEHGLLPLVWPSALLLAGLEPESAAEHRDRATHALTAVVAAAEPALRRDGAAAGWLPLELLRSGGPPVRPLERSS